RIEPNVHVSVCSQQLGVAAFRLQAQAPGCDTAFAETLQRARAGNRVAEQTGAEFQLCAGNATKDRGPGIDDLVVEFRQAIEGRENRWASADAAALRCVRRR